MHMDPTRKRWRVEDVRALPADGNRYDVIRGTLLVTPAPRPIPQNAVFQLARLLEEYCERTGIGRVYIAPSEVVIDDETLVQPDLFVVPGREGPVPSSWRMMPKPMLTVEVISPSSARFDRGEIRRLYSEEGVAEYWIIDTDSRVVAFVVIVISLFRLRIGAQDAHKAARSSSRPRRRSMRGCEPHRRTRFPARP